MRTCRCHAQTVAHRSAWSDRDSFSALETAGDAHSDASGALSVLSQHASDESVGAPSPTAGPAGSVLSDSARGALFGSDATEDVTLDDDTFASDDGITFGIADVDGSLFAANVSALSGDPEDAQIGGHVPALSDAPFGEGDTSLGTDVPSSPVHSDERTDEHATPSRTMTHGPAHTGAHDPTGSPAGSPTVSLAVSEDAVDAASAAALHEYQHAADARLAQRKQAVDLVCGSQYPPRRVCLCLVGVRQCDPGHALRMIRG